MAQYNDSPYVVDAFEASNVGSKDDSPYITSEFEAFRGDIPGEGDGNILTDSARDLGVGLVDLGGAAAGVADLVASPFRDKGDSTFTQAWNESAAGDWKRELQEGYSDARKEAEREYEEYMAQGDGSTMDQFGRAVFGLATNPRAAIGRVFQSAPSMLAGGGVGGAVGKAALARGATTNAAKWAGRVGSGAAEGGISAGQVAGSIAEYNRENNLDPTQGMMAPVVTALGVGAIGTAGGGMEAGLFNKAVRETAKQSGVGAIPKTFVKEGFKEGAEEAAQAPFETVPENLATGKQWDEGLGRNMGEGFATGFGLGGALGTATKKNLLGDANEETTAKPYARDVPPQEEQPVDVESTGVKFKPTGNVEADAQSIIDQDAKEVDGKEGVAGAGEETGAGVAPAGQGEAAPVPQKEAPTKVAIDDNGFRDIFDNIHAPDKKVPKAQLKKVNDLYSGTTYGADLLDSLVTARNEVGSPLNVEGILNIAQETIRKSGSFEDAVEYLRDKAKWYEENAKGKQDGIVKADLCAVAAEYLGGSQEGLNLVKERIAARAAGKAIDQADAARQKSLDAKAAAEAEAAEKVDGEIVDENASSKREEAMARYREFKNGGKAPETQQPTTAATPMPPKDEGVTDIEGVEVQKEAPAQDATAPEAPIMETPTAKEEPQGKAPKEKEPIDYNKKAPWVKEEEENEVLSRPVFIREGQQSQGYPESGKLEQTPASKEQPTAPTEPPVAKPRAKPQAVPNAAQDVVDKVEEEAKAAEQAKAEGQTAPKEKQEKSTNSGWFSLKAGNQASTFNQTRMYENAFEDYKAQFKERPNGDTASLEDHVDAIDKVLDKMPKGEYYASALAVMANQAHTLSSDGITNRYRTWLAIATKAQNLNPRDKKRVMDNVITEALKAGTPKDQVEVLRDPRKYRVQPTLKAKPTAKPKIAPSGGAGGIDSQGMSDLAALGAKLSADKSEEAPKAKEESAKPVASIPTAETRTQEIKTGEHVPTTVEPVATKHESKSEVAPVAKEEPKAEASKGTDVGPAAKIEPINEAETPERLRKWSPNANVPAAKLKDGKNVFKSQEEALKAEMPKNMPKWAESTYNYVVHGFYPTNNRWPTQEEYRDDIWPFLSKEDSFLPDNAVELKTGRAWKRAWFGKITRGSQAVPSTGAKQAKADAKAQREATGRELSEKLSKEWAQLAEEGKVAKDSKPQIHDVRAFLRRERESGAIDSGITIRHISKDAYEPILDTHAKSVFTHQANVAKVEAQKAREVARANPEATQSLPGDSQAKTESGTVAAAKDSAPAKQAGLPVPSTKAAADLIKTFPTLARIKDADTKGSQAGKPMLTADDEARTAMAADTIEEKLKDKTKQEEVDYLEDLLKDARSFPVTGTKATRFSVVAAVISRVFRNTALPSRSAKRYNAEQYSQVIKAISDVLNEETSPLDVKTFKKLNAFKDSLAKQSTLGEDGVSALKRAMEDEEAEYGNDTDTDDSFDSDDSGADATKGGPTENKMSGVFDDNTDEAEARQQAEAKAKHEEEFGRDTSEDEVTTWDDDKVGGESGGSINVESGHTGHRVTRKAKRRLEDLARTFGWIDAKHKSGTGEKFDEAFEDTYETIKERYESASDEERQQVAGAIKTWGESIKYDEMNAEDIADILLFVSDLTDAFGLDAGADMARTELAKRQVAHAQTSTFQAEENSDGIRGGVAHNQHTNEAVVFTSAPRKVSNSTFFNSVEKLFDVDATVTATGKKLKKALFYWRVLRETSGIAVTGRTLPLSLIASEAKTKEDLDGVFSPKFAEGLWSALSLLKTIGVKNFSNIYVTDPSTYVGGSNVATGSAKGTFSNGVCEVISGTGRSVGVRTGKQEWANGAVKPGSAVVQVTYTGSSDILDKKEALLASSHEAGLFIHELLHALDAVSGFGITKALQGKLSRKAQEEFRDACKELEPLFSKWKHGESLDSVSLQNKLYAGNVDDIVSALPFMLLSSSYTGELRGVELTADSISGFLAVNSYRRAIELLAPTFALELQGFIHYDLSNHTSVRVSGNTVARWPRLNSEAHRSSEQLERDGKGTSRTGDTRKAEHIRDRASGSNASREGESKQGASRTGNGDSSSAGTHSESDPLVHVGGVRQRRASDHSRGTQGSAFGGSRNRNVRDADTGRGATNQGRPGKVGSTRVEDTSIEQGQGTRDPMERVGVSSGSSSGDQSRFYDIHHKVRKLSAKEWIQSVISNTFASAKNKGFLGLLFTRDLVSWATRAAPDVPAFKQWHELLERQAAFRNDWQADVANIKNEFDSIKDKKTRDTINEFLELTTIEGVWAYRDLKAFPNESDWDNYVKGLKDEKRQSYNALSDVFSAMPDEAKAVVQKVLRHGIDARIKRAEMMKEHINDRFKRLEELASSQKEKDTVIKERDAQLKKFNDLAKKHRQPYVPLRRFGDHVVTVKSKKYEYTERLASEVYRKLQEKYNGKPTPKQMSPYNKLRSELQELQADPDHYVVQFVQGAGSAKMRAKTLQSQYPNSIVEHFARSEHVSSSIPSWQKLEQVITSAMEAMKAENIVADPQSNRNTQAALTELTNAAQRMYIEALNDDNARKGELRRMKVSGYHTDMMENFAEAGKAEANLYANMSYGAKVRKVLSDMQTEVRTSKYRTAAADYQNEIFRRHNQMLSNNETGRGANALLRTNSFVMLLTSPAYYVQNLMQPIMMSAPYMAGHHGMGASVAALNSAMAKAAKALRKGTSLDHIADGMGLNEEERAALVRARDLGHIDIGMASDFGHITHTDATRGEKALSFVTDKITEISRRVEMVNRIGTFVAAYRLERRRLGNGKASAEAAWQYADEVVYKTHGDYSGINAPRLFTANTLAKIATQFRKFQLIQAGMMLGLAKRAFYDATPLEKAIARRQLAWTMGIHFAMAGAKGTPFVATLLWAMGFVFGGGDDEDDMIRDYIKDKETSDLLLNGIPKWLGIDMSQKVGASSMFSLFPFMDTKPQDGEDFWKDLMVSMMGPTGSLGERAFRAIQYGSQGDYYKGIEAAAPTGVANVMKAFRFGTEGVTTKAGDVHIPGEDFTFMELVALAAGLPPNKVTDRNRVMGSLIRHEEWYDKEQNQINHDYKEAFRARDTRGMMGARKRHRELNERRREEGFKIVPMSRLTKTATDQRKRELKGQASGSTVGVKPSNRRFIQDQLKK